MPDIQDKINEILGNPEALKQVQSLGEQLGLVKKDIQPPKPEPKPQPQVSDMFGDDTMKSLAKILPLMNSIKNEDDTTRLLHSLRPFLCSERREKLDKAEKMLKLIRIIPLLKDNGLF